MKPFLGFLILCLPAAWAFWRGYRKGYLKPMLQGAIMGIIAACFIILGGSLILGLI